MAWFVIPSYYDRIELIEVFICSRSVSLYQVNSVLLAIRLGRTPHTGVYCLQTSELLLGSHSPNVPNHE